MEKGKDKIKTKEPYEFTIEPEGESYEFTIEEVEDKKSQTEAEQKNEPNREENENGPESAMVFRMGIRLKNGKRLEIKGDTSKLPQGTPLSKLAYIIKKNGKVAEMNLTMGEEEVVPDPIETTALSEKVRRMQENPQEYIESKKPAELPGKVKRKMGCIPILIVPVLIGGIISNTIGNFRCVHEIPVEEIKTIAITISGDRNPGREFGALGSYMGQEDMTNRYVMGDGKESYDMNGQADIEQGAIETYAQYAETTEIIRDAIGIINNSNSTQDQIKEALKSLEEQYGIRTEIRDEVRPNIEEMATGFNEAAEAHVDSRTEAEKQIVAGIVDEFDRDSAAENMDFVELQDLNDRIQKGEKIGNWRITANGNGDYVITAQHVQRVVKVEEYRGLKAILHELQEALRDAQNTIENIIENEGDER